MVNITSLVWRIASAEPSRTALRPWAGDDWSFGELQTASSRVGGAVREAGLKPLDRVILIAPTVPEFAVVYYGLHAAGLSVITMNTMSTVSEIEYVLDDSAAELVIAWHACNAHAQSAAESRSVPFWILEQGADYTGDPLEAPHEHDATDTAAILYTSGTTGKPKGAELTASNLVDTAQGFSTLPELDGNDRCGTALPLFHVFGQCAVMNTALMSGAQMSLLSPFEPAAMLEMMRQHRLTAMSGVPTMWNAMLQCAEGYTADDFSELRLASSGGASMPMEVLRAFKNTFGCAILEGYGLTETTGAATSTDLESELKPGTSGPALPGTSIDIRDMSGKTVETGHDGEIFIKGPSVMKSYWNRPEDTAATLQDGWLKTGDLGRLDSDGYLTIIGRLKELIIRGGYNVYPREVEDALYEHAQVAEVAVIGVPDDYYGEEIAAIVALTPDASTSQDALRAWAKERLSAYKVPRILQFVDELPKGPTGKILKRAIDPRSYPELAGRTQSS